MQFSTLIIAILPIFVAAQSNNPSSETICTNTSRLTCPASSDGFQRCLNLDNADLCVIDCQSQTTCRTQCIGQGFINGFCTIGEHPCICSNNDASSGTN